MRRGSTDPRHRPIVLDTGELTPAPSLGGHLAHRAVDVIVVALLGFGAIAAGTWSVITASQGSDRAEKPVPLWYPAATPIPSSASHRGISVGRAGGVSARRLGC
ncbi:MAG TPA: hypothetical protein VFG35_17725, partial [Actinoplanes sp.]|nr:hypothetical protein [Actinoplanes sp.]